MSLTKQIHTFSVGTDSFYDEKYRSNETSLGEQEQKEYYCTLIEDYFKDDGSSGFNTIFDKLTSDLQEISKDSNSTSTISSRWACVS